MKLANSRLTTLLTVSVTAAALAGTALIGTASASSATPGAPAPGQSPEVGTISWHHCQLGPDDEAGKQLDQAGAECGDLAVPLDYSRPDGPSITIAMSRLKATDRARRIGTMVLNDGGPGGPGLDMPLRLKVAMKEVGARYDLIGMDPRFIGRSTPMDCKLPVGTWISSAGASRDSFDRGVRAQADFANRCTTNAGDILPYVTTRNTARDIDQIRIALGEQKVSYLGYSYGTYLGAVYLQLFPGRADRVVLDGPVNPDEYGPQLARILGPANEDALRAWATWAAARNSTYGLGRTTKQVMGQVAKVYRVASRHPLAIGKHQLDDTTVPGLLMSVLGDDRDQSRARTAAYVQTLVKATNGPVQPSAELAEHLKFMLTGEASQTASAQLAIMCGDRAAPRDIEGYWRDIQEHRKTQPYFGALAYNLSPCVFWPEDPREAPTRVDNAVPALLIAADGDPRSVYSGALVLHKALTASKLVTLKNARTHGIYGEYGNTCVDNKVNTYLATGTLPPTNPTCQNQPTN